MKVLRKSCTQIIKIFSTKKEKEKWKILKVKSEKFFLETRAVSLLAATILFVSRKHEHLRRAYQSTDEDFHASKVEERKSFTEGKFCFVFLMLNRDFFYHFDAFAPRPRERMNETKNVREKLKNPFTRTLKISLCGRERSAAFPLLMNSEDELAEDQSENGHGECGDDPYDRHLLLLSKLGR